MDVPQPKNRPVPTGIKNKSSTMNQILFQTYLISVRFMTSYGVRFYRHSRLHDENLSQDSVIKRFFIAPFLYISDSNRLRELGFVQKETPRLFISF